MKGKLELLQSIKILFVDDEDEIRSIVGTTFRNLKVDFKLAENGKEALEVFNSEHDFDLVVTDINMPKMNGLILSKNIKDINENIPIVIMSAHTDREYIDKAKDIGVNRYMTKPFDFLKFLNLISTFEQFKEKTIA